MQNNNQEIILSHFSLLGMKAVDKVTGFKGVITSLSFDLYGCITVAINPPIQKGSDKVPNGHWFDITRLQIKGRKPVVEAPDFAAGYGPDKSIEHIASGKKGAADKPLAKN